MVSEKDTDANKGGSNEKTSNGYFVFLIGFAVFSILSVIVFYFVNFPNGLSGSQGKWGAFGDFIGGTLNPILGFLSLMALLFTIRLQIKELEATREELKRSATAQEKSEIILKKQSGILSRQQFEQTFFSLLEQHNTALEKISMRSEKRTSGRSDVKFIKDKVFSKGTLKDARDELACYNDVCGHYFRLLYQLLKFIATNIPDSNYGVVRAVDDNQITDRNKNGSDGFKKDDLDFIEAEKMYSNMVRAFLDYDVTQILAVNCYCEDENSTYRRYKDLLERYNFLEHMPFEVRNVESPVLLETRTYYSKEVFGKSDFMTDL